MSDFDDLMSEFDQPVEVKEPKVVEVISPEEFVLRRLTEGKHARIHTLRYYLGKQIEFRDMLRRKQYNITKLVFSDGATVAKPVADYEFARVVIADYLETAHAPTLAFAAGDGRGKPDMGKVLDMIVAHDVIQATIENTYLLRKGVDSAE